MGQRNVPCYDSCHRHALHSRQTGLVRSILNPEPCSTHRSYSQTMSYKDSYALTQRVSAFLESGEYQSPDAKPLSFRDKTFQAELLDAKEAVFQAVFPQPSKEEEHFGGWIVSEVVGGHMKALSYLKASVPRLESSVEKTSTDMFPPDGPIYAVGVGR